MSHGNPATRVRLDQHGNMVLVLAYRAGMVYNHLSLLYETVHRSFDGASAATLGAPPTPHPYMALVKDHAAPFTARATPFELWPKALVADLARHAQVAYVDQSTASRSRAAPGGLTAYVRLSRRFLHVLPPVQADVW
jgi:hypothetical protein